MNTQTKGRIKAFKQNLKIHFKKRPQKLLIAKNLKVSKHRTSALFNIFRLINMQNLNKTNKDQLFSNKLCV